MSSRSTAIRLQSPDRTEAALRHVLRRAISPGRHTWDRHFAACRASRPVPIRPRAAGSGWRSRRDRRRRDRIRPRHRRSRLSKGDLGSSLRSAGIFYPTDQCARRGSAFVMIFSEVLCLRLLGCIARDRLPPAIVAVENGSLSRVIRTTLSPSRSIINSDRPSSPTCGIDSGGVWAVRPWKSMPVASMMRALVG